MRRVGRNRYDVRQVPAVQGPRGSIGAVTDAPPPSAFLPARRAPLVYFAFAHACLFTALVVLALRPGEMGGFYYHPRLIALVHLVTLGFLTSAVLGALYLVMPLAFRLPLPEGRMDLAAAISWMVASVSALGLANCGKAASGAASRRRAQAR